MGDKIVTVVTVSVTLILVAFMITFINTERKIDAATSIIQEFTETTQYKGCITKSQYENTVMRIPYKSFKLQITHIIENNMGDEMVMDIHFPNEIKDTIVNSGIYKMNIGDQVKVDLIVKDESAFDALSFMILKRADSGTKMIASDSGVIVNTKYE